MDLEESLCAKEERRGHQEVTLSSSYFHSPSSHSQETDGTVLSQSINVPQRSTAWHSLRSNRLTASSFGAVVGFFKQQRQQLFEEKVGLIEAFKGNQYTEWGNKVEDAAVLRYIELTGNTISHEGFRTYGSWLGGSPDGLIDSNFDDKQDVSRTHDLSTTNKGGILEVKCPCKPSPYTAVPYSTLPVYYVPQVQGLLRIFNREFCDLYSWTSVNGSALFRIYRDDNYWDIMNNDLETFWFQHVLPARQAKENGMSIDEIRAEFGPGESSRYSKEIKAKGRELVKNATEMRYSPQTFEKGIE